MSTNGRLSSTSPVALKLQVELRERRITTAGPEAALVLGRDTATLVGLPLAELWAPTERRAIERRFDDVVLLGADRFGALALAADGAAGRWVEVDARFVFEGGGRLDVALRPMPDAPQAGPWPPRPLEGQHLEPLPPPTVVADDSGPFAAPPGAEAAGNTGSGEDETHVAEPIADEPIADEPTAAEPVAAEANPGEANPGEADGTVGDDGARMNGDWTAWAEPDDGGPAEAPPGGQETAAENEAASPENTPLAEPTGSADGPVAMDPGADQVRPAAAASAPTAPAEAGAVSVVMSALDAAGAAALAVAADGTVASATAEVERLFATPIARLRGMTLGSLFVFPELADEALALARVGGTRQSVRADLADAGAQVALEWVPGAEPGVGFAVLSSSAPESALTEKLRLQARLVSFVAHDVRESLAAVYCGLRTLADDLPPGAPERPTVERALAESKRANHIVDEVLAVSRPGRLTRVELALDGLLRDVVTRYRPRAVASGVEVREQLQPGIRVSADLGSLERGVGNLIENALQATPLYGTLTISAKSEDRTRPGVRISIADTGVGIKPDLQPNIFEPFVTGKPDGTGLGLAIVRRVVLDHEGQIDFVSEEGRGTTFHIWLPRLAP